MTPNPQPLRVTVYTKADCALCEETLHDLHDLQSDFVFELVIRDIRDSDLDFSRYQFLVPVVDIEGGELLYPPHDWYRLRQVLLSRGAHGTEST